MSNFCDIIIDIFKYLNIKIYQNSTYLFITTNYKINNKSTT